LMRRHFCLEGMMLGSLKKLAEYNYVDTSDLKTKEEIIERLRSKGITKKSRITRSEKAITTFGEADKNLKSNWIQEHFGDGYLMKGEHQVDPNVILHGTVFLCLYFADKRMSDLFTISLKNAWEKYVFFTKEVTCFYTHPTNKISEENAQSKHERKFLCGAQTLPNHFCKMPQEDISKK